MMKYKAPLRKPILTLFFGLATIGNLAAKDLVWYDGNQAVSYSIQKNVDPVVKVAAQMFADDMKAVTGKEAVMVGKNATVKVFELDKLTPSIKKHLSKQGVPVMELQKKIDGFYISVIDNQIAIIGTNGRGTAYGLLELSRQA